MFDRGSGAEGGEGEGGRADPENVDRAVQGGLPPSVPAGGADQDDHGEADQHGRDPAVEQQRGQG
ncbi:hypothetical protein SANT12839_066040 [Streptomyces antimycoticus]|uniref:Uncharacterized protein n=1 Tax=Streptomyces antimycoticus TaxID=68175 RepID=A0A4D4KBQ8_9ACTN|nr:hypothetical protein SANT12839_066040 [Streptomyces antimycoticus]